jgi:hypothetical protein
MVLIILRASVPKVMACSAEWHQSVAHLEYPQLQLQLQEYPIAQVVLPSPSSLMLSAFSSSLERPPSVMVLGSSSLFASSLSVSPFWSSGIHSYVVLSVDDAVDKSLKQVFSSCEVL